VQQTSFYSYEKQDYISGTDSEQVKALNQQLSVGISHMKKEIKRCEKLETSLITRFTPYEE
jgi:hypothetical protein